MLGREGVQESAGLCFFVQGVGTQGDRQAAGHTDEIFGWEGHCSFTLGETTMDILRSYN